MIWKRGLACSECKIQKGSVEVWKCGSVEMKKRSGDAGLGTAVETEIGQFVFGENSKKCRSTARHGSIEGPRGIQFFFNLSECWMRFESRNFEYILYCFFPFSNRPQNTLFEIVDRLRRLDTGKGKSRMDVNLRMNQKKGILG